jgi:hypothetical protein
VQNKLELENMIFVNLSKMMHFHYLLRLFSVFLILIMIQPNASAIELHCKKEMKMFDKFIHMFKYNENRIEINCKSRREIINALSNAAFTIQYEGLGNWVENDCFLSSQEIRNSDPSSPLKTHYIEGLLSLCNQKLKFTNNFHKLHH